LSWRKLSLIAIYVKSSSLTWWGGMNQNRSIFKLISIDSFEFTLYALDGRISASIFTRWCPFLGLCLGLIIFCRVVLNAQIGEATSLSFMPSIELMNEEQFSIYHAGNCSFWWVKLFCQSLLHFLIVFYASNWYSRFCNHFHFFNYCN